MSIFQKTSFLVFSFLIVVSGCTSPQKTKTNRPKLPPQVKIVHKTTTLDIPKVGKDRSFALKKLYECMLNDPYEYMFCNPQNKCPEMRSWPYRGKATGVHAIDKFGVFAAGISGIYFYGNLSKCIFKITGKGKFKYAWDFSNMEKASGLKSSVGKYLNDTAKFNSNLVLWAANNLIPNPGDAILGTTYLKIYHSMMFRIVRLMALVYIYLEPTIDVDAKAYQTFMGKSSSADGFKYLRKMYEKKLSSFYPLDENGTNLTGFMVAGFWLRRFLDKSDGAVRKALGKILRLYDKSFMKKNFDKMHFFK